MSVIRIVRGDPSVIDLPKDVNDTIEAGDICWWDTEDRVVRRASYATGADHDERSQLVGSQFVGVCVARRDAGDTGAVPVATRGDFIFRAVGLIGFNELVRVADDAGSPSNFKVQAHSTASRCIGRAVSAASGGYVIIRINGRMNTL